MKEAILSFQRGLKISPKSGACISHSVPGKISNQLLEFDEQVDLGTTGRSIGSFSTAPGSHESMGLQSS